MPVKIPDQTKTTIKGGEANVKILAAGNHTVARMYALLAEVKENARSRKDLTGIADDCESNITALCEAVAGRSVCAEDARRKSKETAA